MFDHPVVGAAAMTPSRAAAAAVPPQHTTQDLPSNAGDVSDAALLAELALTFDLDALVAAALVDPFRR